MNADYAPFQEQNLNQPINNQVPIQPPQTQAILNIYTNDQIKILIKKGFIRKIFGIVTIQFLFISLMLSTLFFENFRKNLEIFGQFNLWIPLAIFVIFSIYICCHPKAGRLYPYNYICLGFWTLTLAYLLTALSAFMDYA